MPLKRRKGLCPPAGRGHAGGRRGGCSQGPGALSMRLVVTACADWACREPCSRPLLRPCCACLLRRGRRLCGAPRLPLSFQVGGAFSIVDQDGARPGSRVECVRMAATAPLAAARLCPARQRRPGSPCSRSGRPSTAWQRHASLASPPAARSLPATAPAGEGMQRCSGRSPPPGCSRRAALPRRRRPSGRPTRPAARLTALFAPPLACRSPQEEEARRGLGRQEGGTGTQLHTARPPARNSGGSPPPLRTPPCPAFAAAGALLSPSFLPAAASPC